MLESRPRSDAHDEVDRIVEWTLRAILALVFMEAGVGKFSDDPQSGWVRLFAEAGWRDELRYASGVLEVLGSVALLVPATTSLAVLSLGVTMIGAVVFHIFARHDPFSSLIPAALLLGVAFIGCERRERLLRRSGH